MHVLVHGNCNYSMHFGLNALFLATAEKRSENSSLCRNQDYRSLFFFYFLFFQHVVSLHGSVLIGLCLFFCLVNQRRKGDAQIISHLMMKLCIQINQCIKPMAIDYNYVCMFHRFQYAVFFLHLHSLFCAFIVRCILKIIMGKWYDEMLQMRRNHLQEIPRSHLWAGWRTRFGTSRSKSFFNGVDGDDQILFHLGICCN